MIVLLPPAFDNHLGLSDRIEDFAIHPPFPAGVLPFFENCRIAPPGKVGMNGSPETCMVNVEPEVHLFSVEEAEYLIGYLFFRGGMAMTI